MSITLEVLTAKIERAIQDTSFTPEEILDEVNLAQKRIAHGIILPNSQLVSSPLPDLFTIGKVYTYPDTTAYVSMPSNYDRQLQFVADESGKEITIEHTFRKFAERYPLLDETTTSNIQLVVLKGTNLYYQPIRAITVIDAQTTISFTATSTISDSGNGLGDLEAGDKITISGAATTANNNTFTVATVQSDGSACTVSETTIETESAAEEITIKRGERLTVHYYKTTTDMSGGTDTPDGIPDVLQEELLKNYVLMEIYDLIEDGIEGIKVNTKRYETKFNKALIEMERTTDVDGGSLFLDDENEHNY